MTPTRTSRDRGSTLPLVLVLTVSLAAVVLAVANYVMANLRYAEVTAERSDRLSAADAGMRYAVDQLKIRNAACIIDTVETELPRADVDFNGADASVLCRRVGGSADAIQAWAAVFTGVGLNSNQFLVKTTAGNSMPKILGGPVYMARATSAAFSLGPELEIADGPLFYFDGGSCSSTATKPSKLVFTPALIFGPLCTHQSWTTLFPSPPVAAPAAAGTMTIRRGDVALTEPEGSYEQIGNCRVFHPGYYVTAPSIPNQSDAYFRTGDYVFDTGGPVVIDKGLAVAGVPDPNVSSGSELGLGKCAGVPATVDPVPDGFGATFYLAGASRIDINTQGALEVHARRQGDRYVSIQALCDPADHPTWCTNGAPNVHGGTLRSTVLVSTSTQRVENPIISTKAGNNQELVTHGLIYAPLGEMDFGNVTSTAVQKLLGGLIVSRVELQASASASNFEIAVPVSEITAEIMLTSTARKGNVGPSTSIRAIVEYRPYADELRDRIAVNSWRVCETSDCE